MDFEIKRHVAVPVTAQVAGPNAHTFPWGGMEAALKADPTDRPYIEVPKGYWEGRKVTGDKNTPARARNRILMHFNTWKKAEGKEGRDKLMLLTRVMGNSGDVGVWMQYDPKVAPELAAKLASPAAPAGASAAPATGAPAKK